MRCDDEQALDLLAQSTALNIFLTRTLAVGSEASDDTAQRRSNNTFQENVGRAYFWPAETSIQEIGVRRLQGEIDISRGLKASFIFPRFSLRVSLVYIHHCTHVRSLIKAYTPVLHQYTYTPCPWICSFTVYKSTLDFRKSFNCDWECSRCHDTLNGPSRLRPWRSCRF